MAQLREIEVKKTGEEIVVEAEPVSVVTQVLPGQGEVSRGHAVIHYVGYNKAGGDVTLKIEIISSTDSPYLFREVVLAAAVSDWYLGSRVQIPPGCKIRITTTGIGANAHGVLVVAEG
jgi:hypothetical protein